MILVDPHLKDFAHHHFNYDIAIARAARRRGMGVRPLIDRAATAGVVVALGAEPVLAPLPFRPLRSRLLNTLHIGPAWQFLAAVIQRLLGLRRLLGASLGRDTLVFVPTCDARNLAAWIFWSASRPAASSPTICLMLRFPCAINEHDPLSATIRAGYALSLRHIDRLDPTGRIKLCTDSRLLAREYSELTTRLIELLPVPHTGRSAAALPDSGPPPARTSSTIVTLGDARREKGFDILVEAIVKLVSSGQARELDFIVHCPVHATHRDMQHHVNRLAALPPDTVCLLPAFLAEDEYYALLESADIVVLPYRRESYGSRTSGPLIEAMAAGKIVIGTGQTWLGEMISEYGGGLTFDDGDAAGLAAAIVTAHLEQNELRGKARIGAAAIRAEHNPESFLDRLVGLAKPD